MLRHPISKSYLGLGDAKSNIEKELLDYSFV